jgi:1-acyl-sn-glycerol-3-phosphate acyltransferase
MAMVTAGSNGHRNRHRNSLASLLRGVAFRIAFYGGSVFFVLASAFSARFAPRWLGWSVAGWSRWQRTCLRLCAGIRVVQEGQVPPGAVLVAIKHESFFEAIDLPHLLGHPGGYAKQELFRIPGWGTAAKAYGVIPVAREDGARALRQMVVDGRGLVAAGRPIAIFPEGTRVAPGASPPLQAGFAGLYKLFALPVVPIAVDSGRLYTGWHLHPGVITIRIGEAIPPGLPRAEVELLVHAGINALNC